MPLRLQKNRTRCMIAPLRCIVARQCFAASTGGARPVPAARAYDAKAAELHGRKARFNFPREWVEDDTGAWVRVET